MTSIFDVAEYVLERLGPLSAMKLQKLVYYAQAWSLGWFGVALFPEEFQAWANGPVAPHLYARHRGWYSVSTLNGDASRLTAHERKIIDAVTGYYGTLSPQALSDLTHCEHPWLSARSATPPGERSTETISQHAMQRYYGAKAAQQNRTA